MLRAVNARGSSAEHLLCPDASGHLWPPKRLGVGGVAGSAKECSVEQVALDALVGKLQLDNVTLAGHSYGGATVAGAQSCIWGSSQCCLIDLRRL
jgi:pimeloyl-ACP methyl ester carboxylesterase